MWLTYIALLFLFVFVLDYFLVDKRIAYLAREFNGPKRWPLIGTGYQFIGVSPNEYYEFIKNIMAKYARTGSRVFRFWIGNKLEVFIDDPKLLEVIFTSTKFISKSSMYDCLNESMGDGLLFSTNEKWFARRRIITPTFHFKILEQFFEVFVKHNHLLLEKIREKANGKAFDIFPTISVSVMDSICETAMGCESKAESFLYMNAVKELGYHVSSRFLTPWKRFEPLYRLTPSKKREQKCAEIMHKFTTKIIEERRAKLLEHVDEKLTNLDDDDVGLKKKMCLLDVLLQSTIEGKSLSNNDIQEEVDAFSFAGHDTTTNVICFTLFAISKYPEVQRKLNEEIQKVIGDGDVTFNIINELKYLDLVIKEAMRIYAPVPIIARRLHEEVDFGDFVAPANTNYNLILYTLFKNPEIFKNPEEFIPERFLDSEKSPYTFVPFSAGQRNCIGQKFAMLNVKNNIINILQKYELVFGNIEPTLQINLTLKCDGIFIGFKPKHINK